MTPRFSRIHAALALVSLAFCAPAQVVEINARRTLAPGTEWRGTFSRDKPAPLALSLRLDHAEFSGASLVIEINGRTLLPYHAFGGDTRFDQVKGKTGMNPPVSRLEANYVLAREWVRRGENRIIVRNSGPGSATLGRVILRPVGGHDLPVYENPIYFDFDVWRQAAPVSAGASWFHDTLLLGIIPGGGAHVMNYSGGDGLALKQSAEEAMVDWGFKRGVFYSIWHLDTSATEWADFINVDGKETTSRIHSQFVNPPLLPKGTDVVMIKPGGYLKVLQPGLDGLKAYATEYNLTCEQWGPRGQGLGRWWGTNWAAMGYDVRRWADNYQEEFGRVATHVRKENPGAIFYAPHWWLPDIRFLLYDTALERGKPMSGMTDAFMTHYYSFPFGGPDANGQLVMDDEVGRAPVVQPELQYPGGKFEAPNWERARAYMGTWLLIPEIAIDWNRYRLGRTEKDLRGVDPLKHRWPDGRSFRFEAGFEGDERSYNNETCVFDRNYSGPAPYQFLYAMFSYSLLPSAAGEASEFSVTRTLPITPMNRNQGDIFSTTNQPVNRYGDWVAGAAGTHRLKTRDPLYGDLFGYTGFEQATTGDYIWLCGIKDRHHRREPYNAWNLVRRTCYAFVTSGPVYPALAKNRETLEMVTKVLKVRMAGRELIGVYAVNFHPSAKKLEIELPTGWTTPATAQLFDAEASDWADAREVTLKPSGGSLRVSATVPALGPWMLLIYPPAGEIDRPFTTARRPEPASPAGENGVTNNAVLRWTGPAGLRCEVELSREKLFRPSDLLVSTGGITTGSLPVSGLQADRRYHWRVRAWDGEGQSTGWSRPAAFWYQPAGGRPVTTGGAPAVAEPGPVRAKRAEPPARFLAPGNLALKGEPFGDPNFWVGAAAALDGNAESAWIPDETDPNEGRRPRFPCWWAIRFDKEETVRELGLLWGAGRPAGDFDVQAWVNNEWKAVQAVRRNRQSEQWLQLQQPVKTRAVRLWITAPATNTVALAEIHLR